MTSHTVVIKHVLFIRYMRDIHRSVAKSEVCVKGWPVPTLYGVLVNVKATVRQGQWEQAVRPHHSYFHKKVLLRERKRHTDRGISSTTRWGTPPHEGTPQPGMMGGTQGGVPPS